MKAAMELDLRDLRLQVLVGLVLLALGWLAYQGL